MGLCFEKAPLQKKAWTHEWDETAPWICGLLPRPLRQCFSLNQAHLQADGGNLYVAIDVEAIVFGGENHRTVVHQRNVEALRVLYLQDQVYKT